MTRRNWFASLAAALPPSDSRRLKLTRFELFPVRVPFDGRVREAWIRSYQLQKLDRVDFSPVLVRLHADNGLSGVGDAKMPVPQAEALLRKLMGRNPWELLHDDSLRGLLIPIYDVCAQAARIPVARLLNPKAKEKVIPTWWSQCFPPALMASEAKLGASLGYRVHKVKARPWEDPVAQASAICGVVPRNFRIWADANSTWGTVEKTLEVVRELARFPNYFAVESPIPRADIGGYRRLRGKLPLKLSEHADNLDLDLWTREKLLDAWIVGAPKLGRYVSGLSDQAQSARCPIWIEHSIDNGVSQVFQCHQVAAYAGLEYSISITHVLEDDCMKEPFTVRDGYFHIPRKPGLGVTLDEAALDKYRAG